MAVRRDDGNRWRDRRRLRLERRQNSPGWAKSSTNGGQTGRACGIPYGDLGRAGVHAYGHKSLPNAEAISLGASGTSDETGGGYDGERGRRGRKI